MIPPWRLVLLVVASGSLLACDGTAPLTPPATGGSGGNSGSSGVETCSTEQSAASASSDMANPAAAAALEELTDAFPLDPPRGPELSWFVLRPSPAIASYRYESRVYGALAAGDLNGDGAVDLVAAGNASPFVVFLNDGDFEFSEATPHGLQLVTSNSLALGDLDNDGDLDLVTTDRLNLRIFANDGTGRFTSRGEYDAPEVPADHLLLVDVDGDGQLDIFGSYPPGLSAFDRSGPNRYFRNTTFDLVKASDIPTGELSFWDSSDEVHLPVDGKSWASNACDLDDDDDQDIVVANDGNVIDFGDHSETTTEVEFPFNGLLFNADNASVLVDEAEHFGLQGPYSSMGVLFEDLDRDGTFEIFITDFGANKLMQRGALGQYRDVAAEFGLDPAHRINDRCDETLETADCLLVSWGAAFRDFDLDGVDELLVANHEADTGVGQPMQLFKKDGDRYREYSLGIPSVPTHALITADFDNDGDLDFATSTVGQSLLVFENTVGDRCDGNWLGVKLVGHGTAQPGSASNAQGIGATVTIEQEDGQRQKRLITSGGVPHGSVLAEAHFGLGEHRAERITVHWPNGEETTSDDVPERERLVIVAE